MKQPNPNCECQGRGYFTLDMMGTAFEPCKKCDTHEIIVSSNEYEAIQRKKGIPE